MLFGKRSALQILSNPNIKTFSDSQVVFLGLSNGILTKCLLVRC